MVVIQWLKFNRTRVIELQFDDNLEPRFLCELFQRLVKGSYAASLVPPRGRKIMIYNEDAVILEMPFNPDATNIAGKKRCGDVLLISPDLWAKVKDY